MTSPILDIAVVGAGPYGLSVAAHAAAADLNVRVIGVPMETWRRNMPNGMFLKSDPWASNLSDPHQRFSLARHQSLRTDDQQPATPISLQNFIEYGLWFAANAVPPLIEDRVQSIESDPVGFALQCAAGHRLRARTVVLALGLMPFRRRPAELTSLPAHVCTHASEHSDLSVLRGKDVTVIGAGQCAIETATLLAEAGARARLVARASHLVWNSLPRTHPRRGLSRLREPSSGLGSGWPNWTWSNLPGAFRLLPAQLRTGIVATALGPAGSWWIRDRFQDNVPALLGHHLERAWHDEDGVRLRLRTDTGGATTLTTDHVIAATGYQPDLLRLTILSHDLRKRLHTVPGTRAPALTSTFESSIPGLYFTGLSSAHTFGPAMRFVYGSRYTATRLTSAVVDTLLRGTKAARSHGPLVRHRAAPVTGLDSEPSALQEPEVTNLTAR